MPSAVDDPGPGRAAAASSGRLERVVHEVGDDETRPQRGGRDRRGVAPRPAGPIPIGVALTTMSASRHRGVPLGPRDRRRAGERGRGRGCVRTPGGDGHLRAGARASASTTGRAAPPAPRTSTRAPVGSHSASRSARTNPSPSVESPWIRPSVEPGHRVDARERGGVVGQLVASGRGVGLVRHGHRQADSSSARMASSAAAASPVGTGNAR